MKQSRRWIACLAMLLVAACLMSTVGCNLGTGGNTTVTTGGDTQPSGTPGGNGGNGNGGDQSTPSGNTATYTVSVKSIGGMVMSGVNVFVYECDENGALVRDENGPTGLKTYGKTNAEGVASLKLAPNGKYRAMLEEVPEGYIMSEDGYPLSANGTEIVLTSQVITGDSANVNYAAQGYKLGDVMHDFTVTDPDGTAYKLSEILKTKKAVVLNFWYIGCKWCIEEFPHMEMAYGQYSDEIEILALNPDWTDDSEKDVKNFKATFTGGSEEDGTAFEGLSFPMAKDKLGLYMGFGVNAYPTSVVIDRYGVICMIYPGAIPSVSKFAALFNHFAAANYDQTLITDPSVLTPMQKPTVEMPSSESIGAALNSGNITVTYSPEEDEYSWPFVVGNDGNGKNFVYASNSEIDSSYAILHAKVTLQANQALAFDYLASCERGNDVLFVLVDGESIYQISGQGTDWETCYPYVALEAGEYDLAFCYLKDEDTDRGDDTVYLSNLRIVTVGEITKETYIPRECATGLMDDFGGFEHYVEVYFNENDGYYHVGSENGPLLLADLMGATTFDPNNSLLTLSYAGAFAVGGVNYHDQLLPYLNMASNSKVEGLCTVNYELGELLKKIATAVGIDVVNTDKQWLQMCTYYNAYGTNGVEFADPIRGLCNASAFPTVETVDPADPQYNEVVYDRLLMPRGYKYKFVPTTSGAYRITSYGSNQELNAWIFREDGSILYTYELCERMWSDHHDENNLTMTFYLEAGVAYYINIAFWDVYGMGTFYFDICRMGDTAEVFKLASPGYFTYEENEFTGSMGSMVVGGIEVVLHTDGYYHEKRADGTVGSIVYVDFTGLTTMFNLPLIDMLGIDGFNFTYSAGDLEVLADIEAVEAYLCEDMLIKQMGEEAFAAWAIEYRFEEVVFGALHGENGKADEKDLVVLGYLAQCKVDVEEFEACICELMGADFDYDEWAEKVKVEDVFNGIYHGIGDKTEIVRTYVETKMFSSENGDARELDGCIAVDAELAEILQTLMDTYSLQVENSWTKLCYYYEYLGPAAA